MNGAGSNSLLIAALGALSGASGAVTAVMPLIVRRLNQIKTVADNTHVLANSTHDALTERVEQLSDALRASDVAVPDKPPPDAVPKGQT
jgi:uncharacterized membrane protein YgcG